jgi:hypothetical protein
VAVHALPYNCRSTLPTLPRRSGFHLFYDILNDVALIAIVPGMLQHHAGKQKACALGHPWEGVWALLAY